MQRLPEVPRELFLKPFWVFCSGYVCWEVECAACSLARHRIQWGSCSLPWAELSQNGLCNAHTPRARCQLLFHQYGHTNGFPCLVFFIYFEAILTNGDISLWEAFLLSAKEKMKPTSQNSSNDLQAGCCGLQRQVFAGRQCEKEEELVCVGCIIKEVVCYFPCPTRSFRASPKFWCWHVCCPVRGYSVELCPCPDCAWNTGSGCMFRHSKSAFALSVCNLYWKTWLASKETLWK